MPEPEPGTRPRQTRSNASRRRLAPEVFTERYLILQRSAKSSSLAWKYQSNQSAIYDLDILHLILVTLSTQHSMPIMDIGTQAATTLIRPVFRERGFRRITICTS
jgi:hypothetical protein